MADELVTKCSKYLLVGCQFSIKDRDLIVRQNGGDLILADAFIAD